MLPPDLKEWDAVAVESYKLKKLSIEDKYSKIKLFSPESHSRYYSTAPYFYDGGVNLINNKLNDETLSNLKELINVENLNYILLKSREEIELELTAQIKIDSDYYTFTLDLSAGEDSIWENKLKSTTRNQVRKAQKQGFEIRIGQEELLGDFYSVITQAWRDLGTPTHSRTFYHSILENMNDKSSLMVVYHQGKAVSCALLLMVDNVIYHPYSCSLKNFKSTCVNNLLYWEIIKYSCRNAYSQFDMGRSRIDQGTYRYKKSWGAEPVKLFYIYILNKGVSMPSYDNVVYKYATALWKFMPLSIANNLGPRLIRNIL
jgi:FemAB-related protein (PEP-CTERM system-associated)